ncbi:hypothetical protein Ccar_15650 [Clostridium carboxidivorans P7]|uniref:DUF1097 domain-containing protein n=1 Tax=Clostridium carboxidivorans P7 TaxID=536227 RepID=C6PUI9_9CLOT|nr:MULTISPECIES: DUF1097 domain-containing protein [Clostridium]AKN32216.1 hypothetical protein Ccar_15650 [Clostridium carboxidivorans P7]EET87092.1 hypothetical protein CcarbDRAFT_2456 [Clostridium carboxidivorans P7]WPC43016.1 DUF1097 domain-containing protein [Clostridium sp. JS66]
MSIKRKALLIQGAFGAVILTLLMQPMGAFGFANYNWMLFVVLLLFFAMGADFKKIPSMIVCYPIGILWAMLNGVLIGALKDLPPWTSGVGLTIVVIFSILTVHENLLRDTIFANIPALFLGLAETFFIFSIHPANAPAITPFHLFGFFLYGMIMSVVLVAGGGALCNIFLGKEWPKYVFGGQEEKQQTV